MNKYIICQRLFAELLIELFCFVKNAVKADRNDEIFREVESCNFLQRWEEFVSFENK